VDTNALETQLIYEWWSFMIKHEDSDSITLLASWGIWNESNTSDLWKKNAPPSTLLAKIMDGARLGSLRMLRVWEILSERLVPVCNMQAFTFKKNIRYGRFSYVSVCTSSSLETSIFKVILYAISLGTERGIGFLKKNLNHLLLCAKATLRHRWSYNLT
jgi:hypothetical protein